MYQKGWYCVGNRYRYVIDCDAMMVYYQTESKFGSKHISGESLPFGTWFKKSVYIGKDFIKSE